MFAIGPIASSAPGYCILTRHAPAGVAQHRTVNLSDRRRRHGLSGEFAEHLPDAPTAAACLRFGHIENPRATSWRPMGERRASATATRQRNLYGLKTRRFQ